MCVLEGCAHTIQYDDTRRAIHDYTGSWVFMPNKPTIDDVCIVIGFTIFYSKNIKYYSPGNSRAVVGWAWDSNSASSVIMSIVWLLTGVAMVDPSCAFIIPKTNTTEIL